MLIAQELETKLTALYKNVFPSVAKYVSKRNGTLEQAQDVFQDALVAWYEQSAGAKISITASDEAYLFGIARHLWYRKYAEGKQNEPLNGRISNHWENNNEEQPASHRLLNLLERSGKRCMDLLKSFYYDKLSMTELAEGFGFRSVRSATVQKYKCLEKIRETVKEKSLSYADFFE